MNLSDLVILLFSLIAATSAAALLAGVDENGIFEVQAESVPVEESNNDMFGENISKVNRRLSGRSLRDRFHQHRFLGHRWHHRSHPHTSRHWLSNIDNQMNSPAEYTDTTRYPSRRRHHHHHRLHHGYGHRPSCNRHRQVPVVVPPNVETSTAESNGKDQSREEIIASIFNTKQNGWEGMPYLQPSTDAPSTTNSEDLLYDIDLRSA